MRYTDYVIRSGTGTRLVTYAAKAFDPETGDALPDEMLEQIAGPASDGYGEHVDRLIAMADAAAASLTPA